MYESEVHFAIMGIDPQERNTLMSEQQVFILIAVMAFVILVVSFLILREKGKEDKRLSPLSVLAFACVVAGIVFGEERWLGYGLIGTGVVLAVIDMVRKFRKSQ